MFILRKNIILILLSNAIFCGAYSTPVDNAFLGAWCWDLNNNNKDFSISIKKNSNLYVGGYDSVVGSGRIIDDNDNAFRFKATKNNIIKTKIKSGITGNIGLVQIKILNNKKIEWLVLREPQGFFYVPKKAILHKCK